MALKPWHTVVNPRPDLCEGKPTDASEFAVHLDQVRAEAAPDDYQQPDRFFERTYLTRNLTELATEVIRRLSGETTAANAVFNLSTQFGGGKTHALTLLYHLAEHGAAADRWLGVSKLLQSAQVATIPKAKTAVFVGQRFDPRGGEDGTPFRQTPWSEVAWQLAGLPGFTLMEPFDRKGEAPGGDTIAKLFALVNQPILILMDELINYISRNRKSGLGGQLYHFLQNLSEEARSHKGVVLAVSLPASELEMTPEDQSDYARFNKLLDRVGRSLVLSAESETTEIIRRRLFQWNAQDIAQGGTIMVSKEARETCKAYAQWLLTHRLKLPGWFPVDTAQSLFESSYPFHPTVLSVFERKWQTLPNFQQTRGILQLLALWISHAYTAGYRKLHPDPLITLGTAPLEDPTFRTALLKQLGETRLEGAITTDICGKQESHAIRLDNAAVEAIKKSRLHRKIATAIFFESNGGQSQSVAIAPEIRLAVAVPNLDDGHIDTVIEAISSSFYYLENDKSKYRFSLTPNLNKLLADRRANVQAVRITDCVNAATEKVFPALQGITPIYFPEKTTDIPNRPVLAFAVLSPDHALQDSNTHTLLESMLRQYGNSDRTFKSGILFAIADSDTQLREEARKLLAWEDIRDEEFERLDDSQRRQLDENIAKAKRDLREAAWRTYKYVALLGKDNTLRTIDLGLVTSSADQSMTSFILRRLRADDEVQDRINARFLVRNWTPAFQEWSTKSVRDAFFASPQFPRLLDSEILKQTIAEGVSNGTIAYVTKGTGDSYQEFEFETSFAANQVEFSDDAFIITAETAQAYKQRIADPPRLAQLMISPQQAQLEPGMKQAFIAKGLDQYGNELAVSAPEWNATGGSIASDGVLQAGADVGNFTVTATIDSINAISTFSVIATAVKNGEGSYGKRANTDTSGDSKDTPSSSVPTHLSWSGEIPTQKWMNFYSRVLSRFAADPGLSLTLKVEFSADGEVSEQKLQETKVALQELGLDDDVQIQ